ncbi:MAG: hypothetical protein AB8G86_24365, partial [Saprospiraceae bacterium]
MRRNFFTPTLFTLLIFLMSTFSAKATIIPVTLGGDLGIGSLRDVVASASAGDTITFLTVLDGLRITVTSEITIDKSLTIMGNGKANTIIDANDNNRVFAISNGAVVTLMSMSITRGSADVSGGGMHISGGATVVLDNCAVLDSEANGAAA